jgi:predicted SnoaL-like aldol condensation-catalyzing enzyme
MSLTREVVERYNLDLWNHQRFEIAPEIIGAQVVRNSPGHREVLSRAEAVDRIRRLWSTVEHVEFTLLHTIVHNDLCTIVYQADVRNHDGTRDAIASIEVFRVVDGRIVEVWNNTHDHDWWPEAKGLKP